MSKQNVFIILDDSELSDYSSNALEQLLGELSEEAVYIRSEDNKGIFMTESADAFLIQEHF